jgi:hypothetical protein
LKFFLPSIVTGSDGELCGKPTLVNNGKFVKSGGFVTKNVREKAKVLSWRGEILPGLPVGKYPHYNAKLPERLIDHRTNMVSIDGITEVQQQDQQSYGRDSQTGVPAVCEACYQENTH